MRRLSSSRARRLRYVLARKSNQYVRRDQFLTPQQKKEISSSRAGDQKAIDKPLIANIKKVDMLASYLGSSFSLRSGDKPHEMAW